MYWYFVALWDGENMQRCPKIEIFFSTSLQVALCAFLLFQPSPQQTQPLLSERAPTELSNSWHQKVHCSCLQRNNSQSLHRPAAPEVTLWERKRAVKSLIPFPFYSVTTSYCMLRMVQVVSRVKWLQMVRIISDKHRNVAAMFHHVLLMFCLKVAAPL